MKIALINNLYDPVSRGGAESLVKAQADLLRKAGHNVVVVTSRPWKKKLPKSEDGIYRIGGFIGSFYYLNKIPKPLRYLWHLVSYLDFITPWYIGLQLALSGCKVAIGHNLTGISLWLPFFLKKYKIKYIQLLHDVQYLHPSGLMLKGEEKIISSWLFLLYQKLTRKSLENASKIVSPSNWLADLFISRNMTTREKLIVLPNPIDIQSFLPARRDTNHFKFLFVGQLEKHKGIIELLKAFNQLKNDVSLEIIGDGSLNVEVSDLATLDPRIKLHGRLTQNKVHEIMNDASALIIPSICYENYPTVILEAFSHKLPVIGSDWGGTKELLNDSCGILINPLDHEAFVNSLESICTLDSLSLNLYAERAFNKFKKLESVNYSNSLIDLIDG